MTEPEPEPKKPLKPLNRPASSNVVRVDKQDDYTAPTASNRALHINLYFMKFGTTDRLQGAAIFLSVVFLCLAAILMVVGVWSPEWAKEALAWLATPLMLVVGVAVGRGGKRRQQRTIVRDMTR